MEQSDELTAEQFDVLEEIAKNIKTVYPAATVVALDHIGESEDCENTVIEKSVRVAVDIGVCHLTRKYQLP